MEYKDIEVKLLRELSKEPFYAVHTREQAEGAWPNGTSVQKIQSAAEDKHQDGSRATVTGSLGPFTRDFIKDPPTPDDPHLELYFYFRRMGGPSRHSGRHSQLQTSTPRLNRG